MLFWLITRYVSCWGVDEACREGALQGTNGQTIRWHSCV